MQESNGFVEDGYFRLQHANAPAIRAIVETEYADLIENANWFQRRRLRKQIESEIKRRCDEIGPPDALY